MTNKNDVSQKLFNAALLGAICVAPLAGGIAAQAAPPDQGKNGHDSSQSRDQDKGHNSKQSSDRANGHGNNQSHTSNRSHVTPQPQSHRSNQEQPANQSHATPQSQDHRSNQVHPEDGSHFAPQPQNRKSHDTNRSHVKPQPHYVAPNSHQNWQRTNNNHYDDNWHRSHGYTRNGSHWYWRGHDDDYWINRGYGWNGSIWIILNSSQNSYGSYRTFEGVVTHVNYGDNKFDIRINGNIYNVYVSSRLPGRLNRGDFVRVYGQRYGNNDIRNSSVNILRYR